MTIREKVEEILNEIPQARGDDRLLIAYFIKDVYKVQNTFDIALSKEIKGNIYESIRRARQKVQETNPTLRPPEAIYKARLMKEAQIREEMRGV